uniref:Uncharacterized protein n=1 Tax=Nelumbo nucifera TaxID=4432 RepID=A0A822YBR5_NELNU|nr:TPA_asm: hypothetical protein HUJ06_031031 [Nelumbo nucifera]
MLAIDNLGFASFEMFHIYMLIYFKLEQHNKSLFLFSLLSMGNGMVKCLWNWHSIFCSLYKYICIVLSFYLLEAYFSFLASIICMEGYMFLFFDK